MLFLAFRVEKTLWKDWRMAASAEEECFLAKYSMETLVLQLQESKFCQEEETLPEEELRLQRKRSPEAVTTQF